MPASRARSFALAVSLLLVASAAGAAGRVDFDPEAPFERFKTFRFVVYPEGETPPTGALSNPVMMEEFEDRLAAELSKRGLRRAKEGEEADLVVRWWSGVKDTKTVDRIGGFELFLEEDWSSIYGASVQEYVGRLLFIVDLIDAHSAKLAWRAYLPVKATDPPRTRERLLKEVQRSFARYPPSESERKSQRSARAKRAAGG